MADLSKLRFNGTDYNVKDASAPLRKFTNYSKTGNLPITSDDTTQTAIGKLEKALDDKINTSAKGTSNGVAELDANGKVPSSQLPSYVDDVLEYSAKSGFPATGETGKIYVDTTTNKTYRWSGSAYVEISESLALGETSSTAYRGDHGKAAYDHSQITNGNPHGTTGANTNLTGYSKGSSKDAVAATDTVNAAIAKHENRINANQTNILLVQDATEELVDEGAKNMLDFERWSSAIGVTHGTKSVSGNTITLTSDGYQCYTEPSAAGGFPIDMLPVEVGKTYVFSWKSDSPSTVKGAVNIFPNGSATGSVGADNTIEKLEYTVPSGVTYVTFRLVVSAASPAYTLSFSDLMFTTKAKYDASPAYAPYALPNYDLTYREQQDRNALVEVVDKGAKNIFDVQTPDAMRDTSIVPLSNGGITISCTNAIWSQYIKLVSVIPNKSYRFMIYVDNISQGLQNFDVLISTNETTPVALGEIENIHLTGAYHIDLTPTTDSINVRLFLNNTETAKTQSADIRVLLCSMAEWKSSPTYEPHALPNTDLTRMVNDLQKKAVKVYTYHVNPNESDPEDAVTYLDDATGLTPAKMGASSFSYGSWDNAWFLPRPCMLKSDGTVAYYLNPNDYSKKTDGTASDIADLTFDGNVMLEFPKIWIKRVDEGNGARTVSIAPVNVDGTYKCWSNINAEDKEVDHFYLPAYNGTIHSSKMRSLSGVTLDTTYAPNYTRAQEVTAATANNPSGKNMWYTETWADMCLIFDLLYLMGKSLNLQGTFGNGLAAGGETEMRAYVTGSLNDKGLFYGDISGQATGVKVLGMENLWGCRWHGVAGLINDNGALKVKMTYGVADGSTTVGYNTTGSGYLDYGSTYGTAGYVKKMQADNTMGYKIIETAGTDATYYCDYYYTNNSQLNYALLGGRAANGLHCGFYVHVSTALAYAYWDVGGSLSCRPES